MATVSRINGIAVNVGYAGTTGGLAATITSLTNAALKATLQSGDYSNEATRGLVGNEVGDRMASFWTDPYAKASLKFVITGTGLADVIAQTAVVEAITPGMFLNISACQQEPGFIASNWEVVGSPKISGTNKTAKEWTVELEKAANITGAATA